MSFPRGSSRRSAHAWCQRPRDWRPRRRGAAHSRCLPLPALASTPATASPARPGRRRRRAPPRRRQAGGLGGARGCAVLDAVQRARVGRLAAAAGRRRQRPGRRARARGRRRPQAREQPRGLGGHAVVPAAQRAKHARLRACAAPRQRAQAQKRARRAGAILTGARRRARTVSRPRVQRCSGGTPGCCVQRRQAHDLMCTSESAKQGSIQTSRCPAVVTSPHASHA